jgi:tRNA-2-methylthio-N6-dimethylallyladenosine synthase
MAKYYIWTIGCQMNKAESLKIEEIFQLRGYEQATNILEANVVVVNTCVVRKNAEDKVLGMLGYLSGIKKNKKISAK